MGLFDRLRSIVGSTASVDLRGPLGLALGDGVGYYRDQFTVAGVRRLQGTGSGADVVWHYCLCDADGERAVLVVEGGGDGAEPALWMHRVVASGLPWDTDVIDGIGDEPFKLAVRGQASVLTAGDTGVPPSRTVAHRSFRDGSGDRVIVLEDWGGHREGRIGECVHEAELTLTHASDSDEGMDASSWDQAQPVEQARGTPGAAAAALGGTTDEPHEVAEVEPREEHDPTAYSDDQWDDEGEEDPVAVSAAPVAEIVESEEDEWRAAAQYLREQGSTAERKA